MPLESKKRLFRHSLHEKRLVIPTVLFRRLLKLVLKKIEQIRSDQSGSAVVEFVMIATPLFIPAVLFFNAMQNTAKEEMNTSYIARQAVRAFATAPDALTGHWRIKYILDEFSKLDNNNYLNGDAVYGFTYRINCSTDQCLTPGALVELKLYRVIPAVNGVIDSKNRKASAVARTYVDKWRSNK